MDSLNLLKLFKSVLKLQILKFMVTEPEFRAVVVFCPDNVALASEILGTSRPNDDVRLVL